jgi:uncharacterized membrane protein HdeD (DUF308 family)
MLLAAAGCATIAEAYWDMEWVGLSGLISILVGLILILRPGAGVLAVAWLIGIFAILLGTFQLLLGLKFRKIDTGPKS